MKECAAPPPGGIGTPCGFEGDRSIPLLNCIAPDTSGGVMADGSTPYA